VAALRPREAARVDRYRSAPKPRPPGSLRVMDDADAVRDELDRLFTGRLAEATAAAAVAIRRLDEWQRGGFSAKTR